MGALRRKALQDEPAEAACLSLVASAYEEGQEAAWVEETQCLSRMCLRSARAAKSELFGFLASLTTGDPGPVQRNEQGSGLIKIRAPHAGTNTLLHSHKRCLTLPGLASLYFK